MIAGVKILLLLNLPDKVVELHKAVNSNQPITSSSLITSADGANSRRWGALPKLFTSFTTGSSKT